MVCKVGTLDKDIQRVMVALDIREETVAEAIEKGVDLIIVKHAPYLFVQSRTLVASRPSKSDLHQSHQARYCRLR